MNKLAPSLAAALCAAGCATSGPAAQTSLVWPTGRYELEANVDYDTSRGARTERFTGELLVRTDGSLLLTSSSGACLDPSEIDKASDRERGERSFECGDVRYVLRPAGSRVVGQVAASVDVEVVVSTCIKYMTDKDGNQVCTQTDEHTETHREIKRAQVTSHPIG